MKIRVALKPITNRSYDITVATGALSRLHSLVGNSVQRVFIVTDSIVENLYGRKVQRQFFESGIDAILVSFPAGEKSKNSRIVESLHTQLLKNGIRRSSLVVALGGGVVGDVAGFVAATVLRGVKFIQVPTTLLAQVDSSVGGKVGIDHPVGKNLIGAFHQPAAAIIDSNVLRSLDEREFRNGLAEVVKIGAALDKTLFQFMERNAQSISKRNSKLLAKMIKHSVGLKARVVEHDEFESGLRKTLNLGHTFGHALETALDFTIKHGEAVSIGLVAEAAFAVRLGFLEAKHFDRVLVLLKALGLPTKLPRVKNKKKFFAALRADKKSSEGGVQFVLMNGIGSSIVDVDVPESLIEEYLES